MTRLVLSTLALCLLSVVLLRAGLTRALVDDLLANKQKRPVTLRVWDWWSPSANEEYGQYFAEIERRFEAQNPDIDVVYQIVPFGNYVQKLSTAMVGNAPPDVFQSSVYWAEGFYQRGMLRPLDNLLEQNRHAHRSCRSPKSAFCPLPGATITARTARSSAFRRSSTRNASFGISKSCRKLRRPIGKFARSLPTIQTAASTTHGFALTPCATGTTSDA